MEMPHCVDEETESGEGTFLPRGIQTFQGEAWRTASSLAFSPDTLSQFPSRYLLRFLCEPFLACSSFPPLIFRVALSCCCHGSRTLCFVDLIVVFPPSSTRQPVDFSPTLLRRTRCGG